MNTSQDKKLIVCPNCGATDIITKSPFKKLGKAWRTGVFSPVAMKVTFICKNCKEEWVKSIELDK